ncbi:MAG TPA: RagB/SusD family nutrient uptake outer membrane protein [Longimicrobiales bacterium]
MTMMTQMFRRMAIAGAAVFLLSACDLDLTNPNNPTEEEVITDVEGVYALAVGMQGQFAQSIEDYVFPSALVTDELGTRSASLLSYQSLFTGQSFENTYDIVSSPYNNTYAIVKSANTLLTASSQVGLGANLQAGVRAVAKTFKAMALGMAAQSFEELPVNIAVGGADPRPREEVLDTVIALLESARADIVDVPDTELTTIGTRILPTGFTLPMLRNTIDAMIARYSLQRGQYQDAIDAATRVSATILPSLIFTAPERNPVERVAVGLNYLGGTFNFVAAAEPGDQRPAFWLRTDLAPIAGNPGDSLSYNLRKYSTPNESFPLYLPDEMKLIRAEAQAQLGMLPLARGLINEVRTQAASPVAEPVANLPALLDVQLPDLDAILRQIAYERRYELYLQGLRWDDVRRLPGQTAPTFTFLPLPARECTNNPFADC